MYTKVLWTFSEPVREFSILATLAGNSEYTDISAIETGPANTSGDTSTDWPRYLFVPAAGCWEFEVDVITAKDSNHRGSFVFIAVE